MEHKHEILKGLILLLYFSSTHSELHTYVAVRRIDPRDGQIAQLVEQLARDP